MKSRFLVWALLFSLVSLGAIAFYSEPAQGSGLYCFQLKSCGGEAGCPSGADVMDCNLSCTNGGTVHCLQGGGDDEIN